ncbi:hypothetical protein BDZ90DRAFT_234726 [Jaminaea rosea]|uniref:Uncharacterized protein n=1 Tax=Jaminaea rosea TaxID=1569628 RepID=A0A316UHH1_9BASI|nr:hypothetical protein BDZ90DRAFT_234726 [Jaminaea rosea]PWN24777.1 hypothetical protein BDZ90DRAFT_234726 [Jaminaea rosea]
MKDWIRSPEPEDPDEVAARHRRYEEEELQRAAGNAEASSSRLDSPQLTTGTKLVKGKRRRSSASNSEQDGPSSSPPPRRSPRTRLAALASPEEEWRPLPATTTVVVSPRSSLSAAAAAAAIGGRGGPLPGSTWGMQTNGEDEDGDPARPLKCPRRGGKTPRLMSLADMSFRTVLTHLPSLTAPEVRDIVQPCLSSLSSRFSNPLSQACEGHLDHLARLSRAKEAALRAREEARQGRRTSVAIEPAAGRGGIGAVGRGRAIGLMSAAKPKVEKSKGGQKIWKKARMAAGPGIGMRR